MVRRPRERRWQLAAPAPLGFLALGLGVVAMRGDVPPAEQFIQGSGIAANVGALATTCVSFWALNLIQRERAGQPALGRDRMPR